MAATGKGLDLSLPLDDATKIALLARLEAIFRGFVAAGRLEPAAQLAEHMRALLADPVPPDLPPLVAAAMERMAGGDSLTGLLDALHRLGKPVRPVLEAQNGSWATCEIQPSCTACQMCAFFCPTGALKPKREYLLEQGIGTGDYYSVPAHSEPAASVLGQIPPLPETESACREVVTLPIRPSLTDEQQKAVVEAVRRFFAGT